MIAAAQYRRGFTLCIRASRAIIPVAKQRPFNVQTCPECLAVGFIFARAAGDTAPAIRNGFAIIANGINRAIAGGADGWKDRLKPIVNIVVG